MATFKEERTLSCRIGRWEFEAMAGTRDRCEKNDVAGSEYDKRDGRSSCHAPCNPILTVTVTPTPAHASSIPRIDKPVGGLSMCSEVAEAAEYRRLQSRGSQSNRREPY